MTIMVCLTEKGWLHANKQGQAYPYHAVRVSDEVRAESVGSVLRVMLQDLGEVAVSQLVKELAQALARAASASPRRHKTGASIKAPSP